MFFFNAHRWPVPFSFVALVHPNLRALCQLVSQMYVCRSGTKEEDGHEKSETVYRREPSGLDRQSSWSLLPMSGIPHNSVSLRTHAKLMS